MFIGSFFWDKDVLLSPYFHDRREFVSLGLRAELISVWHREGQGRLRELLIILPSSAQVWRVSKPQGLGCSCSFQYASVIYTLMRGGRIKTRQAARALYMFYFALFLSFHQMVLLRCLLSVCFSFYHRGDIQQPGSCLFMMLFRRLGTLQAS